MCSGRVDPLFVILAFKEGADGVLVGGCKIGECKYSEGNLQALVLGEMVGELLKLIGIKEDRFKLEWVSSAEPAKLVEDLRNFMGKIKELGPLGIVEGLKEEDLSFRWEAALGVCENMQVRTAYGNIAKELKKMKDFSLMIIQQKVKEKLLPLIKNKLYEIEIKKLIQDGPKSLDYLVKRTGANPEELGPILNKLIKA